ncbi:MAG: hypothetical protein KC931_27950, partial [Candidatus Omnitrophica bacterium]|nr:hypothetical protein [Candidatus Omnitrophota bacterium]
MNLSLRSASQFALYGCILWVGLEGLFFISSGLGWDRGLASVLPFSPFSEIGLGLRILCWILGILLVGLAVLALIRPWIATENES